MLSLIGLISLTIGLLAVQRGFDGADMQKPEPLCANEHLSLYWHKGQCCGVVAAVIAANYLDKHIELEKVVASLPVSITGTSMAQLKAFVESEGMSAKPCELRSSQLIRLLQSSRGGICGIALLDGRHWVTVIGLSDSQNSVVYYDYPNWATRTGEEFSETYSGKVLLVGNPNAMLTMERSQRKIRVCVYACSGLFLVWLLSCVTCRRVSV